MEVVRTMMLNVIVLVFFTTLLDLLLPDGTFRSYMKMAMGLFTVLTLLQPVTQLLQQNQFIPVQQELVQAEQSMMMEVTRQSDEISKKRQQLQNTMQTYWEEQWKEGREDDSRAAE